MRYFWVFSRTFAQTSYLFTFCFFAFSLILDKLQKMKTETKKPNFRRFCLKMSVFVANKTLIFSDLRLYRANHTPPHRFWHSQGGSALFRKFFIFYFLFFFVKYYDFANSAFLLNFCNFCEYHIYFSFCIKFHSICFCLFLWLLWRFM